MSERARAQLGSIEDDSRKQILAEWQAAQARLKIKWQELLNAIELDKKINGSVSVSFLYERSRMATLLVDVNREIQRLSVANTAIITTAQAGAVEISAEDTTRLLQSETAAGQIVRLNPKAANALIGSTQVVSPLRDMMDRFAPVIQDQIKTALIDGVILGSGARQIASKLNEALGTGAAHALTVARTETNQAYRQATIEHYKENKDIVKGWIWLAALDLRTCPICWSRHGKIYQLALKPVSHPNCRCTMVAATDKRQVELGSDKFLQLTKEQKLAILGRSRFDLYQAGLDLDQMIGYRQTRYGLTPYIRPLDDLPEIGKIKPAPVITPKPKPAPVATSGKSLAAARQDLKKISIEYGTRISALKTEERATTDQYWKMFEREKQAELLAAGQSPDQIEAERQRLRELMQKHRADLQLLTDEARAKALQVVRLKEHAMVKIDIRSKLTKEQRAALERGVMEFNQLVSKDWLQGETFSYYVRGNQRAYYDLKRGVHIAKADVSGSDKGLSTIIHETAHGLENLNQDTVLADALKFYEYRTAGEPVEKLSKITGAKGYRANETAKRDKFINAYDGKTPYKAAGYNDGKVYATELISRGFEYMWQDAALFAEQQPDYFDFIWKVARGERWQVPK